MSIIQDGYLRKLQLTEREILDEIVRICSIHGLEYYLIGGTLLGAVRHKGFIPWDDDLDIVMPRADYERFCKLCIDGELHPNYYLHNPETDPSYWLIFAKVRKRNTVFDEKNISHLDVPKGIYVDIFPLDDAGCVNSFEKKIRTKFIKALNGIICYKRGLRISPNKVKRLVNAVLSFLPYKVLRRIQYKLMTLENGKGKPMYVNYGSNYHTEKQTMPKKMYRPAKKIEFEGTMYNCPNDHTYVLNRIYGADYMTLPPVEKRVTHRPVRVSFEEK